MTPQTATSLAEIRAAMAATNAIFNDEVIGKRKFDALDVIYTADARILPPGAPMIAGREAIKKFWKDLLTSANGRSCVLESVEVMPAGDGVVEIGKASLTIEPAGQSPATMEVKYVVYWRNEDNRWKWHVDIWNLNA